MSNAIKFTVEGEIVVQVELLQEESQYLKISVSDTGIGIKEEDQRSCSTSLVLSKTPRQ